MPCLPRKKQKNLTQTPSKSIKIIRKSHLRTLW